MSSPSTDRDERLQTIIADYLEQQEAGRAEGREELLARYPDLAAELGEFFAAGDRVDGLVVPLHRAVADELALPPRETMPAGFAPGELGDFRIGRELGRGGMGVVYEAEQVSLRRKVALKVLPLAATLDPRRLQRFQNEARAAASLHHTNIVPVFAVGEQQGVHYYAMQLIAGQTLAAVLQELRGQVQGKGTGQPTPASPTGPTAFESTAPQGALSTDAGVQSREYIRGVARLGAQAAEALDYAHQLGVVHRDVKPGNLMVDARGQVWVTDFGLALFQQGEPGLTLTGDLVGTLRYMSPEQALGKRVVIDHRTDLYSLGATLYELLTLQPVFPGTDRQELLRQIAFEDAAPLRKLNKAVPAELETIVLKALEKNHAERYATAQDLADDLRRFLEDKPIQARPPSIVQRVRKWARRHKPLVAAVSAVLLIVGVVAAGLLLWWTQERARVEADARAALREASGLLKEERWPEALSAARRGEAVLATLGGDPSMVCQIQALIKDIEMGRRLQEVDLLKGTMVKNGHFDDEGPDAAYAAAFRDYELDVDALDTSAAAEQIRARPIHQKLVAALDSWAVRRNRLKRDGWRQRLALARAADPDPLRNRLRDFLEGKDPNALDEVVKDKQADDLPVPTLVLLARLTARKPSGTRVATLLERARQRHPGDFWINEHLGLLFHRSRPPRLDEAILYFSIAVALRPQSPGAHLNLALALDNKGLLDKAIAEYHEAIGLKTDYPEAHCGLGNALRQKGKLDEAIDEYRVAVALNKDWLAAHGNLGTALILRGRLDEGIAELRQALRLDKDDVHVRRNLGHALKEKGQLAEATAEYREVVRLQKDDPEAHKDLASALLKGGQFREAVAELRLVHELGSRMPGWSQPSAQWLRNAERLADLDARLPALCKGQEEPKDTRERLTLAGICHHHRQLYAAAARWYSEAFEARPALVEDVQGTANRYEAAGAAALAGCGQGKDAGGLDVRERQRLRKQALDWLKAELQAWARLLDEQPEKVKAAVTQKMTDWLNDADFAGVHGANALSRLAPAEQADWQTVWQEVQSLRIRAAQPPAKAGGTERSQ
jgi:serine/threonine protein kinase/Flp pilus assembly protein TadD